MTLWLRFQKSNIFGRAAASGCFRNIQRSPAWNVVWVEGVPILSNPADRLGARISKSFVHWRWDAIQSAPGKRRNESSEMEISTFSWFTFFQREKWRFKAEVWEFDSFRKFDANLAIFFLGLWKGMFPLAVHCSRSASRAKKPRKNFS